MHKYFHEQKLLPYGFFQILKGRIECNSASGDFSAKYLRFLFSITLDGLCFIVMKFEDSFRIFMSKLFYAL